MHWEEPKKPEFNARQVERIRQRLSSGPRRETEFSSCCAECRTALKWMRYKGVIERVSGGRVRLRRQEDAL